MAQALIEIDQIGGLCPVQAEGRIGGKAFYFRARGQAWSIGIGGEDEVGDPEWFYEELYGDGPFDAGYMTVEEARALIEGAAGRYLAGAPSARGAGPRD